MIDYRYKVEAISDKTLMSGGEVEAFWGMKHDILEMSCVMF